MADEAVKRHAGSHSWEITVGADASAKVGAAYTEKAEFDVAE